MACSNSFICCLRYLGRFSYNAVGFLQYYSAPNVDLVFVQFRLRNRIPCRPSQTLVALKLRLQLNFIAIPFPSLKSHHVTVCSPHADSMERLFSCCPALEDFIIDGDRCWGGWCEFKISAPKLKHTTSKFVNDRRCLSGVY